MRTFTTFIILTLGAGCSTDDNDNSYGDIDRRAGDNVAGGDNAGDSIAGDAMGGDTGLPVFDLNITATCPTFTPCGGNEVGTWVVTDVCIEESVLLAELFTYCATATVSDTTAPASGIVTFTGTMVDRFATAAISADILIPSECGFCACGIVDAALDAAGLDATCDSSCNASSECACTINANFLVDEGGPYTAANNTITTNDGRTFDYCINGNQFQYVDTTAVEPEPGLYTMSRQ